VAILPPFRRDGQIAGIHAETGPSSCGRAIQGEPERRHPDWLV